MTLRTSIAITATFVFTVMCSSPQHERITLPTSYQSMMGAHAAALYEQTIALQNNDELSLLVQRELQTLANEADIRYIQFTPAFVDTRDFPAFILPGGYCYFGTRFLSSLDNYAEFIAVLSILTSRMKHTYTVEHIASNYTERSLATVLSEGAAQREALARTVLSHATNGYSEAQQLRILHYAAELVMARGYTPYSMVSLFDIRSNAFDMSPLIGGEMPVQWRSEMNARIREMKHNEPEAINTLIAGENAATNLYNALKGD